MITFYDLIKSVPKEEIEKFFDETFLKPLTMELDGKPEIPAEWIRQKRLQTLNIRNQLLTLRNK